MCSIVFWGYMLSILVNNYYNENKNAYDIRCI